MACNVKGIFVKFSVIIVGYRARERYLYNIVMLYFLNVFTSQKYMSVVRRKKITFRRVSDQHDLSRITLFLECDKL